MQRNVNKGTDWVVVGRFGRPHGIKGFITIVSFTEPRDNILRYKNWHARLNHEWQPIKLLHSEVNNKFILAHIEGYLERETASLLTNIEIAVKPEELPKLAPGEYYWHELVGMHVINQDGTSLGTIEEIMPTGTHDVLVISGEEKRHLIPYLQGKFVIEINDDQRVITVDWDTEF